MSLYFKDITILDENFDSREHMNVLVEGAKITYVGEEGISREGVEIYEGKNKFLMPGFYNLHCHVPMTLLRGHGDRYILVNPPRFNGDDKERGYIFFRYVFCQQ